MLNRLLFLVIIFSSILFSISQESIDIVNSVSDINLTSNENQFYIQTNNIGDPFLPLKPVFNGIDLSLVHYSQKHRSVLYTTQPHQIQSDSIYSHIVYKSAYSGGILNTFLTRPVGKFMKLDFSYNHLNSDGFYANQENKYSSLYFKLKYFNSNNPYYFDFYFSSNNVDSYNNGGVIYDSLLGLDLMNTYLNDSQTVIKNRIFNFQQSYDINLNLTLKHTFLFNIFNRDYTDTQPLSFYYSLTPLDYLITSDYKHGTFYSRIHNSFCLYNKKIKLEFNHNYYNSDNISSIGAETIDNVGDFDILLANTWYFKDQKNIDFKINFCPLGYNKNNYIVDFNFYKNTPNIHHIFNFSISSKKPDFFTRHYDTSYNFDWKSFLSIKRTSGMWTSNLSKIKLIFSASINHYRNYLYFNYLVSPVQSNDDILYFNLSFTKKWILNNFSFKTDVLLQNSNNDIISVPSVFFKQLVQYNYALSDDIRLLSSFDFHMFSKYYINSYFPLTDLFYLQLEDKNGLIPFVNLDVSINRDNFSIGCIFSNLTTFFYEGESLISGYPFAPPTLQLLIKWQFLN